MKQLMLRFFLFAMLFVIGFLLFFHARFVLNYKEGEIKHLEKIIQRSENQKRQWQKNKLCLKENIEESLLNLKKNNKNFLFSFHQKLTGDFLIWEGELKTLIPQEMHWAEFLKNLNENIPAQSEFSRCVFNENARTLHCLARFYQIKNCN